MTSTDPQEEVTPGRLGFFGSLLGLVFLINMGRIVFAPLIEPFRAEFVLSGGEAGLIATLAWLGSAAPRLPTGYLLTRVPRHHVVLFTGGWLAGAALFTAAAQTIWMVYLGAFAMGLSSGAYFIAANPLVSELFPERVGRAIGIHGTAFQLAAVVAPLLVSVVLIVDTWRMVFVVIATGGLATTLALYVVARRTTLPTAGENDRDFLGAARSQWKLVLTGIAIVGLFNLVWNGVFNLYVTYLVEVKGIPEATGRNLLTVVFAAGVPAFWITGRLADRLPYVPLLFTILGTFALAMFALTLASGVLTLALISVVLGYVSHSMYPAIDTFLLASLPDTHRGSAYSVFSAAVILIAATGSVTLGTLDDLGVGYDFVFQASSLVLLGSLVGLVALYVTDRLPTGAAPA